MITVPPDREHASAFFPSHVPLGSVYLGDALTLNMIPHARLIGSVLTLNVAPETAYSGAAYTIPHLPRCTETAMFSSIYHPVFILQW